jgi:hypothetical protein
MGKSPARTALYSGSKFAALKASEETKWRYACARSGSSLQTECIRKNAYATQHR